MKLLTTAVLVSLVLAEGLDVACPTVTKSILNPSCNQRCDDSNDCDFVTTVQNPCGCPTSVPTATLLAPCEAGCPYNGCNVQFRSVQETCTTMTSQSRRPRPTSTATITSSTPSVSTGITTLPPPTATSVDCPTVTVHSQPADCDPLRCPVPSCYVRETMTLPCGCDTPNTVLYVEGCSSVCPDGCATRTSTESQGCARATARQ